MSNAPRHDIYAFIHKGLRAFMAHTLVRVGRLDAHDPAEVAEVGAELKALLAICRGHLEHENHVIHSAMQARAPGSATALGIEHEGHIVAIDQLAQLLEQVPGNAEAAKTLYRTLSHFVAENFEHMQREETEHNAVLWATHTDDEIRALEHRIVSSLKPEQSALSMRWMLPHMTPAERAAMLGGMRRTAPAEVFDTVLSQVRPLLGGRDWRKLSVALDLGL
ncbi:hemerythrin domain-containing protein [Aquabacterium sp.]|uniref:hemerythrin domain-containing protein n=1 Tax=Aquabacterium sp. TaxID=1872578 RepID=UPI0037833DEE